MKKLSVNILLGLVTIVALSTSAQAQETQISGFVDMSYATDENADTTTFGMDQAEIDIKHSIDEKASMRFDLQYVNTEDDPATGGVDESRPTMDDTVEQGFITINLGATALTFGKFNAPIGFEMLDAPDMYQYSHAMVFDYGLPTNLTGIMLSGGSGGVDYVVYFVNGWDKNGDDNKERTVGTRIGITSGNILNLGFSYISGKEGVDTPLADPLGLTVTDIDLTYTPSDIFTLGAEYNTGTHKESSTVTTGADAKWTGYLVMVHYVFNDIYGLTVRYDTFNDEDGERLGGSVGKEKRNATTVALTFGIADGLGGLFEWKTTKSDKKPFTDKDGNPTGSEAAFAAELTYSF